jgi:tetratricopeptide (TPR) repeat protein
MADLAERAERAEKRRQEAAALLAERWGSGSRQEAEARSLLAELRGLRLFDLLALLADRLARLDPKDAKVRKLQTQALIETGHPTAAAEVARAALHGLPDSDPEWKELNGLIGRAYKQILMEAGDPGDRFGQAAIKAALDAYRRPLDKDPDNHWLAINVIALLSFARRMKIPLRNQPDPRELAAQVITTLESKVAGEEPGEHSKWSYVILAEAYLALGDLDRVGEWLRRYFEDPWLQSFDIASTLRQFSQLWGLKDSADERRQGILHALYTRLLKVPGAQISYSPQELVDLVAIEAPKGQLQKILRNLGTKPYDWWKLGMSRAASVGAVYSDNDQRTGTCFLVRGEDFGVKEPGAYALTNAHVVAEGGRGGALRPEDATVVFEACHRGEVCRVDPKIVHFSPIDRHDACLLRLEEVPPGIEPLPLANTLPLVPTPGAAKMQVYVIGYPGGGGLEFSFQDNELLDHEGDTAASPCRVHYTAPTEEGSSGSPVFNRGKWEVIALHHLGGKLSRLNGKAGSYPANEGISIFSIAAEFKSR